MDFPAFNFDEQQQLAAIFPISKPQNLQNNEHDVETDTTINESDIKFELVEKNKNQLEEQLQFPSISNPPLQIQQQISDGNICFSQKNSNFSLCLENLKKSSLDLSKFGSLYQRQKQPSNILKPTFSFSANLNFNNNNQQNPIFNFPVGGNLNFINQSSLLFGENNNNNNVNNTNHNNQIIKASAQQQNQEQNPLQIGKTLSNATTFSQVFPQFSQQFSQQPPIIQKQEEGEEEIKQQQHPELQKPQNSDSTMETEKNNKKQQSLFKNANKFFVSNFLSYLQSTQGENSSFYQFIMNAKQTGKANRKVDLFTLAHYRLLFLRITQNNISQLNEQDIQLHISVFKLPSSTQKWDSEIIQGMNDVKQQFCNFGKDYFTEETDKEISQRIAAKNWTSDMKSGYMKWIDRIAKKIKEMEKGEYIYRI